MLILQVSQKAKALGMTQESIRNAVGISQSQISRILRGQAKTQSKAFRLLCNYVNNYEHGVTADLVKGNVTLIEAITAIWDGSDEHALALSAVIRSLGLLKPNVK